MTFQNILLTTIFATLGTVTGISMAASPAMESGAAATAAKPAKPARKEAPPTPESALIVVYEKGCLDFFVADGPKGYYVIQGTGGYYPSEGEIIYGMIGAKGRVEVSYPGARKSGKVYVDSFGLTQDAAFERYHDICRFH